MLSHGWQHICVFLDLAVADGRPLLQGDIVRGEQLQLSRVLLSGESPNLTARLWPHATVIYDYEESLGECR